MREDRLEPLRRIARRLPFGMALGRWLHVRLDPELRMVERMRRRQQHGVFQQWPHTEPDRYPQLFDALAERLAGIAAPRILSFGCSSGEEVRALRQRIPAARITGVTPTLAPSPGHAKPIIIRYRTTSSPSAHRRARRSTRC